MDGGIFSSAIKKFPRDMSKYEFHKARAKDIVRHHF
jgi:hypothetical protein